MIWDIIIYQIYLLRIATYGLTDSLEKSQFWNLKNIFPIWGEENHF